jgi:hypothetical protein
MASAVIDETGNVYGRLTVVEWIPNKDGRGAMWRARCKCGRERAVRGCLLRAGLVKSCGCMHARGTVYRESKEQRDPVLLIMQERDTAVRVCADLAKKNEELTKLVNILQSELKKATR